MRNEVLISGAIIGVSFLAAVAIAGGPGGIWPDDDEQVTIDAGFGDGSAPTMTAPESAAPDTADRDTSEADDGESDAEPDAADADTGDTSREPDQDAGGPATEASTTTTVAFEATVTQGTTIAGGSSAGTAGDETGERAGVRVAVANGAGIAGMAGEWSSRLAELGYDDPAAINAEPFGYTLVYAAEGAEAAGARLAGDAGLPAEAVFPMADVPPLETSAEFDLVLVLGTDQRADG